MIWLHRGDGPYSTQLTEDVSVCQRKIMVVWVGSSKYGPRTICALCAVSVKNKVVSKNKSFFIFFILANISRAFPKKTTATALNFVK